MCDESVSPHLVTGAGSAGVGTLSVKSTQSKVIMAPRQRSRTFDPEVGVTGIEPVTSRV